MFFAYLAGLLAGVYLAPGIAMFPRAVFDSRLAFAIPAIGVLAATLAARLLKGLGLFVPEVVIGLVVIVVLIAAVRLRAARGSLLAHWPRTHQLIYLFSLFAVLPIAVKQGHHGFSTNDEIYSWNLWAIQHFSGEPIDFSYTDAPYPQTFSYLIALGYQLLGSIDLQLPVKASFGLLAAAAIAAIGVSGSGTSNSYAAARLFLLIYVLYAMDVYEVLSTGLAETLMVPVLTVSIALYFNYRDRGDPQTLALCAGTALLAALSKQPALIWLMIALPVLMIHEQSLQRRPQRQLWPLALCWLGGLVWLLTEGWGFENNVGVVSASQEGRAFWEQLAYASDKHLLGKPAFLFLLIVAAIAVHAGRYGRGVFWLLLMPSLFAWLIWGAYNTRLGTHVMLTSALLVSVSGFKVLSARAALPSFGTPTDRQLLALVGVLCVVSAIYSSLEVPKLIKQKVGPFSYYDAPANVIWKFFGDHSGPVIARVFRKDAVVWAPSAYVYGIFFKHNPVARSSYAPGFNASQLREDLINSDSTIAVDAGELARVDVGSRVLRELLANESCGSAFSMLTASDIKYRYVVYEIDRSHLVRCQP